LGGGVGGGGGRQQADTITIGRGKKKGVKSHPVCSMEKGTFLSSFRGKKA